MKYILIFLFSIMVITFLTGVICHYHKEDKIFLVFVGLAYTAFYSFLVLGSLLILIFFFHLISESILSGLIVSFKNIYPTFCFILLLFISAFILFKSYHYITNCFVVKIENNSDSKVENISFIGRKSKASIDYLNLNQDKEITFRGKDRISALSYEDPVNNIYFNYTINGIRYNRLFADDTHTNIPDTVYLKIFSKDSVSVNIP